MKKKELKFSLFKFKDWINELNEMGIVVDESIVNFNVTEQHGTSYERMLTNKMLVLKEWCE